MSALHSLSAISGIKTSRGFTLVELVAVIVLLGILSVGASGFIRSAVEIYQDTLRRDDLSQQGRFVVERISRELRNALPGSVRVINSGLTHCVEFIPVEAASIYLSVLSAAPQDNFQAVDFDFISVSGRKIAVYPVDNADVYSSGTATLADLDSVGSEANNERRINLSAAHRFAQDSPQNRFYIINSPVSFCASEASLVRYQGGAYGFNATQIVPPAASGLLVTELISLADINPQAIFVYSPGDLQRAAVVQMDLRFNDSGNDEEWLRFSQAVFIRNTP